MLGHNSATEHLFNMWGTLIKLVCQVQTWEARIYIANSVQVLLKADPWETVGMNRLFGFEGFFFLHGCMYKRLLMHVLTTKQPWMSFSETCPTSFETGPLTYLDLTL